MNTITMLSNFWFIISWKTFKLFLRVSKFPYLFDFFMFSYQLTGAAENGLLWTDPKV